MRHLIGITMGCPSGIGPEIILKFFSTLAADTEFQPIVLGDLGVLRRASSEIRLPAILTAWRPGDTVVPGTVPVCNLTSLDSGSVQWGKPNAATGRAMALYIEEAVRLIKKGILAAVVTCPITKQGLNMAGCLYPGHTEMLAALTGTDQYLMMMAGARLRVILVTIHEPLRRVAEMITTDKIGQCIAMTAKALSSDFGLEKSRIAVAGLNPHSSEQGMFGREEQEIIAPAIAAAKKGCDVSGPWPPDTVFYHAAAGRFDAVIAMYHDQGLIPFKLLHFADGVNVTLGLPIVRTSVDHGTAYDIAGRGIAESSSLEAAFSMAGLIVGNRMKRDF
ncbi:MAG: 4-hydroxythreonine-4-phosphate dehydrogenase PdxA [Desulfobulbaceae bacterium]|nr:4-hydroxythreonine-4-phosphate dehydrogenase PdxA [Desulfobulbaceae bacterium]